jgi:ribonuclease HI
MMFKGSKVYASVDEKGALLIQKGRVEIKYQLDQDMKYRALASSVKEIDEAVLQAIKNKRKKKKDPAKTAARAGPSINSGPDAIAVFTDGACGGNPGPAGIGIVLHYRDHKKEISRFIGQATNNIAELTAIKIALREIKDPRLPVNLYTDSSYCQKTLSRSWKPKKNKKLIEEIKKEMTRFSRLNLIKVEGHKGIEGNEHADQLAQQAVQERKTDKK